jgi:hypothetical protein
MARPKSVNPKGEVKRMMVSVPKPVATSIEREAQRRGVTISEVMRERLSRVA